MADSEDESRDIFPPEAANALFCFELPPEQQQLILQLMAQGQSSHLSSAWFEEEEFSPEFSIEEIKSDPKKYVLHAAEHNDIDVVQDLLTSEPSLVNQRDDDEYTPLHRAAYNGHTDMVKFLLQKGADINARTLDRWQPFHSACRWDNVDTAKVLIEYHADIHTVTNGNNTALHLAASHGEAENILKFLLKNTDIDIMIKNVAGDTAEDIARRISPLCYSQMFKSIHEQRMEQNATNQLTTEQINDTDSCGTETKSKHSSDVSTS